MHFTQPLFAMAGAVCLLLMYKPTERKDNTMTISEFIDDLEKARAKYGDLKLFVARGLSAIPCGVARPVRLPRWVQRAITTSSSNLTMPGSALKRRSFSGNRERRNEMDDYIKERLKDAFVLFDNFDKHYAYIPALKKWLNVNGAEYCLGLADMRNLMENDLLYFAPVPLFNTCGTSATHNALRWNRTPRLKYKDGPIILHNTGDTPAIIECKHIVNFAINKGWGFQLV